MPYKDPEKRRAANRERMRRKRAEGAYVDPAKETERKAAWYAAGGKQNRLESDRRRAARKKEEKLNDL